MKNFKALLLLLGLALVAPQIAPAQDAASEQERTLDDIINDAMTPVTEALSEVIFYSIPTGQKAQITEKQDNGEFWIMNEMGLAVTMSEDHVPYDEVFTIQPTGEKSFDVLYGLDNNKSASFQYGQEVSLPEYEGFTFSVTSTGSDMAEAYQFTPQKKQIPFVLIWLIVGALFFTVFMKFVNIRGFKHALDVVRGKYDDPDHEGEVSHFQALTAALSGTVGVGNIAGVALAISMGGPGATFWMILAGLIGMSSKFVECTLGVKYRKVNEDGSVSGGPMYYLKNGLKNQGKGGLGKVLAVLFAIACIGGSIGGGNMVQINQATQQLIDVTGGETSMFFERGWVFGLIMAVVVGLIIIGGIKSIARVTDKIVPGMVAIYIVAALIVIIANIDQLGWAFGQIFSGAFSPEAVFGGVVGVLILGFQRAAFSNEAGIGSASIAHSAAKTDEPISEGIVALLEPFIDTVVICTMTAIVIIITNFGGYGAEATFNSAATLGGISLTSSAFGQVISWFPIVLSIAVILFALSTMISWSYYGLKAWTFLFGESKGSNIAYKAIFCLFIVVGSAMSLGSVFAFGDVMIFAMCFPNVLGLYFLAPEIKNDLQSYLSRVKSGEIKKYK
ncbi:MAG: alanine:cation symporter family protein [Flavobacteriales bacterium]|nr:alanine:cation symporter family protein [Flavobacteriales bacterium]